MLSVEDAGAIPDPWGYSHPRCRGLPTCSSSTSSPAVKTHKAGRKRARGIKVQTSQSLDAILSREHEALAKLEGVKKQGLMMLNPGELSGYLKDPDGELAKLDAGPLTLHCLWRPEVVTGPVPDCIGYCSLS